MDAEGNPIEELVPGFSTSALKFVRKVKALSEVDENDDELLGDDMETMKADLEKIDEDIKDEVEEEQKEEEKVDPANFDRALYKIP